jgi:hypothetical protein
MNVEIEAEVALFPEKEYINGIAVAVYTGSGFVNEGKYRYTFLHSTLYGRVLRPLHHRAQAQPSPGRGAGQTTPSTTTSAPTTTTSAPTTTTSAPTTTTSAPTTPPPSWWST